MTLDDEIEGISRGCVGCGIVEIVCTMNSKLVESDVAVIEFE